MVNSGRPLVLFHPWPQGGTNFGDAATAKLPTLHQGMLRLLRGHGHIASAFPLVTPGRMGLSGYSAGGPATLAALRANGWAWWNFSIGFRPELQQAFDRHHQFALYGGQKFETAPDGTVLDFTTFLEEFLQASGY